MSIPTLSFVTQSPHQIESILNHQTVISSNGSTHGYQVYWKGLSKIDNTWITKDELRQFSPELLEEMEQQLPDFIREMQLPHTNVQCR